MSNLISNYLDFIYNILTGNVAVVISILFNEYISVSSAFLFPTYSLCKFVGKCWSQVYLIISMGDFSVLNVSWNFTYKIETEFLSSFSDRRFQWVILLECGVTVRSAHDFPTYWQNPRLHFRIRVSPSSNRTKWFHLFDRVAQEKQKKKKNYYLWTHNWQQSNFVTPEHEKNY